MRRLRSSITGVVLLSACGSSRSHLREAPPAAVDDGSQVRYWVARSNPRAMAKLVEISGPPARHGEACPRIEVHGSRIEVLGGCRDRLGQWWSGTAIYHTSHQGWRARFDHFGWDGREIHGRVHTDLGSAFTFRIDAILRGSLLPDAPPETLAVDYRGEVRDGGRHWSGEGMLSAEGHGRVHSQGTVAASPECDVEPADGTMILRAGDHTSVVQLQGACDGSAHWTLDGIDRGRLDNVLPTSSCAIDPSAPPQLAWLLVPVLAWRRRGRRSALRHS